MMKLLDGVIDTDICGSALPYGPAGRLCSPARSHLLVRDQLGEGSQSPADRSGLDAGSSPSSRARRAAPLRSEVPSLR